MSDTTEQNEHLFAELDAIGLDPYTVRAMARAKDIETLLNADSSEHDELTGLTTADLANEAIDEMDERCPYVGEFVLVTGMLTKSFLDDETGKYCNEDVLVTREVLRSFGYTMRLLPTGIGGKLEMRVGNLFHIQDLPAKSTDQDLVQLIPRLTAFALVGGINVEYNMEDEDNNIYLQGSVPEILDEIDGRISNAATETDALQSLSDLTIAIDQDIPGDVLAGLLNYVWNKLSLDTMLPYSIELNGIVYETTNGAQLLDFDSSKSIRPLIVQPAGMSFAPQQTLVDADYVASREFYWCVDLIVVDKDANTKSKIRTLTVPVSTITGMYPTRDMIFGK